MRTQFRLTGTEPFSFSVDGRSYLFALVKQSLRASASSSKMCANASPRNDGAQGALEASRGMPATFDPPAPLS